MDRRRTMMFPDDLVLEILSWLPVKSVIQCKCVCKVWCSFIESKDFSVKHIENWGGNVINSSLFIRYYGYSKTEQLISLCTQDESGDLHIDCYQKKLEEKLDYRLRMIGPCNGIICLYGIQDKITLWNPAIREFEHLPRSSIRRPPGVAMDVSFAGFGFDSVTSDYKVVIFLCGNPLSSGSPKWRLLQNIIQVEIYSLNTNSWRKYDDSAGLVNLLSCNAFCVDISASYQNEIYCWLALVNCSSSSSSDVLYSEVVLSFDMCNQVFHTTLLPQEYIHPADGVGLVKMLCSLLESVALVVYNNTCFYTHMIIQIWTIKDILHADGESSWTKTSNVGPFTDVLRPLGFWRRNNNGDLLLILRKLNGDMEYCDCNSDIGEGGKIITNTVIGWNVKSYSILSVLPNYVETLVSVKIL